MDDVATTLSALRWWRDAGVDMLVDDVPRDWLRPAIPVAAAVAPGSIVDVPVPPAPALPDTLAGFAAWWADPATFADLGPGRVAASGDPASGLMILSDMPEAGDAENGALFSGGLERLFDRILAAIGRDRASIYLASLCPARPAGGRLGEGMTSALAAAARHHVALAGPRQLLLMGKAAIEAFGLDWPTARGRLHDVNHGGGMTQAVATFHPRMLPQSPARKADLWCDLRLLIEEQDR